jgi:hypothetical protein
MGEVEASLQLICNFGARSGGWWVWPPGRLTPGKDAASILQEAGWASGTVWTDTENLATPPPPGFDPRTVQPVASRYNANVPDNWTKRRKRKTLIMSTTWTLIKGTYKYKGPLSLLAPYGIRGKLFIFILHCTTALSRSSPLLQTSWSHLDTPHR